MSKDAKRQIPLTAAHVSQVLAKINSVATSNPRDLSLRALQETAALPGVVSTYIIEMDVLRDTYSQYWLGLEGELRESEESPLTGSLWADAVEYNQPTLRAAPAESEENSSQEASDEATSSRATHRCMLPLHNKNSIHWMLVLQSDIPEHFSSWDSDLLGLLGMQLRSAYIKGSTIEALQENLSYHHQRLSLSPPSLFTSLYMGRSFLSEGNPIVATMQHNLDAMRIYQQRMIGTIDYFIDETKLYASDDALQRINSYQARNKIPDIIADMDLLMQDTSSGLFQLRYYLNLLTELGQSNQNQEQFELETMLQPVMSMLFNSKQIQFRMQRNHSAPLYGNRTRLQQAFMVLFLSILRNIDVSAQTPQVQIETGEEGDDVFFSVRYPTASASKLSIASNEEEYLFVKQVMEEHQGNLNIAVEEQHIALTIYLPIMFEENSLLEGVEAGTPFSFEQVGGFELPALESEELLAESSQNSNFKKVILLSSDTLYARSMRRVLQRQFDVYLAPSRNEAIDLLSAHPDFGLLLCDIGESAEDTFEVLDELRSSDPGLAKLVCFLVGDSPTSAITDFARRLASRCCDRHASIETIQRFINRHRRAS